jgi:hypothetical protein
MTDNTTALTVAERSKGFALFLNPETFEQVQRAAEMLAVSAMVPKAYQGKPGDIIIAAAMGDRLGLDLFSSLAGIACINGRPCIWGDAMLAVCQRHRDWSDFAETFEGDPSDDKYTALCSVTRRGREPYVMSFAIWEAKHAGLWGKEGPWTNTPKRMLQMRARAFALRGAFADALAGFHAREEYEEKEVEGTVTHTELDGATVKEAKQRTVRKARDGAVSASPETSEPARTDAPEAAKASAGPDPVQAQIALASSTTSGSGQTANATQVRPLTYDDYRAIVTRTSAANSQPQMQALLKFRADNGLNKDNQAAVFADPARCAVLIADLEQRLAAAKAGAP